MYNQFYGFREKPFEITPDPRFLYLSESHKEALAHLTYAVRERKGFTVITGEVGTGKTTLVQTVLSRSGREYQNSLHFQSQIGLHGFPPLCLRGSGFERPEEVEGAIHLSAPPFFTGLLLSE